MARPAGLRLSADPFEALARASRATAAPIEDDSVGAERPPYVGGWIGNLCYELGRVVEPAAWASCPREDDELLMFWQWCPAAYVHDNQTGRWWVVGRPEARDALPPLRPLEVAQRSYTCSGFALSRGKATRYKQKVADAIEYIRAGDIFQANISDRFFGGFSGCPRSLFVDLARLAAPWYGAYIEHRYQWRYGSDRAAHLSLSPELFLDFDPATRIVRTRPIKGTRPVAAGASRELAASEKDAAELAMIVDLMRNDLGRVCEYGSIRVAEGRALETHGAGASAAGVHAGVVHGVATVEGRLRAGLDIAALLKACFPAGSITGAPKVRAMQIIDELEASPRGAYSGSIGYLSDCGRACFNVAIRTASIFGQRPAHAPATDVASIRGAAMVYSAGAGIVADSNPGAEWDETLAKCGIVMGVAGVVGGAAMCDPPTCPDLRGQEHVHV